MHLNHLNYAIWLVTTGLEVFVCVLAYRRGLQRRLPFFTAYLTVVLVSAGVRWAVYRVFDFGSWAAYDAAWIASAITLTARGLAIGELCFRLLCAYRGIWALAWRILLAVSCMFLLHAAVESASRPYWLGTFVLALDRDLELTATGVLIALLLIGRYYTLEIDSLERRIAGGFCFLSAVIVMSNAAMLQSAIVHPPGWLGYHAWLAQVQTWWNSAQGLATVCVLVAWAAALRKSVPAVRPTPVLLPASIYRELSPAVNFRLRAMNARLLELLKS
ncbi:MAG: hypothetical protein WA871_01695 [Candidatus Acidiferrales bacterium]